MQRMARQIRKSVMILHLVIFSDRAYTYTKLSSKTQSPPIGSLARVILIASCSASSSLAIHLAICTLFGEGFWFGTHWGGTDVSLIPHPCLEGVNVPWDSLHLEPPSQFPLKYHNEILAFNKWTYIPNCRIWSCEDFNTSFMRIWRDLIELRPF